MLRLWTALLTSVLLAAAALGGGLPHAVTFERAHPGHAESPELAGRWHATLKLNGHDLNFTFRLVIVREHWRAVLTHGEEVIHVEHVDVKDGTITIAFPHYDSKIVANFGGNAEWMGGAWSVFRGDAKGTVSVPFWAEKSDAPRYTVSEDNAAETVTLPERWSVSFADSDERAVGIFRQSEDDPAIVTGTFLTTTGDYRFLEGVLDGDELVLSTFGGAHAFLFKARLQPDGSLLGVFFSGTWWTEAFHATPDPDARLPDAFALTSWEQSADLSALSYPDLDGDMVNLGEFAAGSPTLITLTASWCPNCADAAKYMKELHERYAPRGLKIIALSFERYAEFEKAAAQARKAARHHGSAYPVLVAGISDKAEASKSLPALDRVRAYPSTIFVDGSGDVLAVHQGYAGPAAGEAHDELRDRFESIIERMLTR